MKSTTTTKTIPIKTGKITRPDNYNEQNISTKPSRSARSNNTSQIDINTQNRNNNRKVRQDEHDKQTIQTIQYEPIETEYTDLERKYIRDDLSDKFNLIIINLLQHITEYYCDTNMAKMRLVLENIIIEGPNEPISHFLLKVYKIDEYRLNILKQNDKFFTDKLNKVSESDKTNENIAQMFEFRDLWLQIDDDTKNYIKKAMCGLVKICQKYVLLL